MTVFDSRNLTPLVALREATNTFSQPKLRRHELWAVTCYFRSTALRTLVYKLRELVKLTDIYVLYDHAEDFRNPDLAEEIAKLKQEFEKLKMTIEFRRIKAESGIFHSKGYAVIQRDGRSDDIRDNYLLITSGNLTEQGLGLKPGSENIELSYGSNIKKDVKAFIDIVDDIWNDKNLQAGSSIRRKATISEMRLRILLEARYLCKWDGSIRQELSAIFKVAEECIGRVTSADPRLAQMGFDLDQRSLSKYYFDERPPKPFPKTFLKKYTASTLIGHWCPSSVWDIVKQELNDEFREFRTWLELSTSANAMQRIAQQCQTDLKGLRDIGIVIEGNPMELLQSRISQLVKNDVKLRRLYCQLEDFSFCYDLEGVMNFRLGAAP